VAALNLAVAGAGATIGAFITGLYAVFAALLAPLLLGEPLRAVVVAGFAAALAGAALLSGLEPDPQLLGGLGYGVAAALVYALYLDLGRRWSRAYSLRPELLTLASTGTAVPLLAAWLAWTNPNSIVPVSVKPEALLAVIWVAAAWAFGQILIQASVRRVPASLSSAFLLLNPLTAAALGFVVLGERLAPVQLLGGGLVLVGMGLVLLVPGRVSSGLR
jgi:drug/metabolite transporter (DMT)-like permease